MDRGLRVAERRANLTLQKLPFSPMRTASVPKGGRTCGTPRRRAQGYARKGRTVLCNLEKKASQGGRGSGRGSWQKGEESRGPSKTPSVGPGKRRKRPEKPIRLKSVSAAETTICSSSSKNLAVWKERKETSGSRKEKRGRRVIPGGEGGMLSHPLGREKW